MGENIITKPLRRFDFVKWVVQESEVEEERKALLSKLELKCSRWTFQLERGDESGKLHFQGKLSLKAARTNVDAGKLLGVSVRAVHNDEATEFYVTKSATSEGGPWTDKDMKKGKEPWDLAVIKEWYPWQKSVFESLEKLDDRVINVLFDETGGRGKSKVYKKAVWEDWAGLIPAIGDAKDIIQAVCSMGAKKAYIIDLPRSGESETHMRSIYKAIECIKNGVVMDFRYQFKQLIFGSPVIWIFTNQMPEMRMLSADRWRIWNIREGRLEALRCNS